MSNIPVLRLRKDIWEHFPVNVDAMGRGANGADRHCVEWHNMKVRQAAQAAGMSADQYKSQMFPKLFAALSASKAWTVEAPEPGSKCVAVLRTKFAGPGPVAPVVANRTRKAAKAHKVSNASKASKANNKTHKATNARHKANNKPAKKSANKTHKAAKNFSKLEGDALLKKAMGLINLMSEKTVQKLSEEFATLVPKTQTEFDALMKLVSDQTLKTQAYHPLIIQLLHVLDAKHATRPYPELPSAAVSQRILDRAMDEPRFVKMELEAEESDDQPNNFEDSVNKERAMFRSCMLFTGFLYREGFLPWSKIRKLLQSLNAVVFETDADDLDYRTLDASTQGLMFVLIRAGQRMLAEGGEAAEMFDALKTSIAGLRTKAARGLIKTYASEFIESVDAGFKIKEAMPWTVGAPKTDVRVQAPQRQPVAAEGLGSDISELWRRFPLDVKQQGSMWVVQFHKKKLQDRFAREVGGKYKSVADLEAALSKHVLKLIDGSKFWKRGPSVPGTLVSVVAAA